MKETCEPSRLFGVFPSDVAGVYEAGSGGWPLCVPHAYVAFRPSSMSCRGLDMAADQAAGGDFQVPVATLTSPSFLKGTQFHRVSLEADDDEVSLLLSTAKTSDAELPPWLKSTRLVVPRGGVLSARHWTPGEVVHDWPTDLQISGGQLFHNWVEMTCTPRNSPESMSLLLALPTVDIARRFHEAYSSTPRPSRPPPVKDGQRAALVCELQLLAQVDLSQEGQVTNTGMSMRRSICEAMGISRNRVKVLSVREGGGSILGWAAVQWSGLQKALEPPLNKDRYYPDV